MRFKRILDLYCKAFGQLVNLSKSSIFFGADIVDSLKLACCGCYPRNKPGFYLSIPTLWEKSKYKVLEYLKDRIAKKIKGWKGSLLSTSGKEVLSKAVAFAVPTYSMCVFLFSKKWCNEVMSLISNF